MDNTYPVVVTVDNVTYNFTQESLIKLIEENNSRRDSIVALQDDLSKAFIKLVNLRSEVYDFFNERHESGDTEITVEVSDVNDLLESIGADKLRNLYTASVTINVIIGDIEAVDEDEVRDIITDEINVDCNSFDITIDDINVDSVREQ